MTFSKEDIFHYGQKAVLQNEDGDMLLIRLTKAQSSPNAVRWDLPGGRLDRNEKPIDGLKREIFEETGIKHYSIVKPLTTVLSPLRIRINDNIDLGLIVTFYHCTVASTPEIILSHEHCEYRWVSPLEAAKMLHVNFPQALLDLLPSLARSPLSNQQKQLSS